MGDETLGSLERWVRGMCRTALTHALVSLGTTHTLNSCQGLEVRYFEALNCRGVEVLRCRTTVSVASDVGAAVPDLEPVSEVRCLLASMATVTEYL